jgi:hypothetical protein
MQTAVLGVGHAVKMKIRRAGKYRSGAADRGISPLGLGLDEIQINKWITSFNILECFYAELTYRPISCTIKTVIWRGSGRNRPCRIELNLKG